MDNKGLLLFSGKKVFQATHQMTVGSHYQNNAGISSNVQYYGVGVKVSKGTPDGTYGSISPSSISGFTIQDMKVMRTESNDDIGNVAGGTDAVFRVSNNTTTVFEYNNIGSPVRIYAADGTVLLDMTWQSPGGDKNDMYYSVTDKMDQTAYNYLKAREGQTIPIAIVVGGVVSLLRRFFSQLFRKEVLA